jgi:prevent-host-death family protein
MKVGIHEAKTHLSKLIPLALSGEEVLITKGGKPLVKLIPAVEPAGQRRLGAYKGRIKFHHDLLAPLPDEIIADFYFEKES